MLNPELHHVIAIGASAGALDELYAFFDHTQPDGVSYVILQHLTDDFKTGMIELLAKHGKQLIREAENGTQIKSNEVYLIPRNKHMIIRDNVLYLTENDNAQVLDLTINRFFKSLADDYGARGIGVVLSGLGSDGTEGIKAIKKAGGLVIVRDPENSDFKSMPVHAIATGLADFILEPDMMPVAIEDFVRFGQGMPESSLEDDKNIVQIIDLIKEQSPLDFSDYKQSTILRRTKRRAAYANFTSLSKYLHFLKTSPEEVEALGKDFIISVTSFFRDKEAFAFIQQKILPALAENLAPEEELKFWVAGCATGEEVYSMAILIHEQLSGNHDNVVKIFATDIDKAALAHAGRGVYSRDIAKNVSAERLERYFLKEGNSYRIIPAIRKMVIFALHDLAKHPPYCNIHFISCRNLLIYMNPVLQKKVFSMLLFGLKKNGYLFLGASETPLSIIKSLETIHKKWKIYRNLEAKKTVGLDTFLLPELLEPNVAISKNLKMETAGLNSISLAEAIMANVVAKSGGLIVCVDENNHVVQTYGDVNRYLLQKNFNDELLELLPKPLLFAFNTLSKKALKTLSRAEANGIKIKSHNENISVAMSVTPLIIAGRESKLLMVTFDADLICSEQKQDLRFDESVFAKEYIQNLEEEVKALKGKLRMAQDHLDASNENLQSFNEELLTSNEEMQSTNEEMQSINEELETINSSYQTTNKELQELNDDLNNYFRSNINGQLFIDSELRLMKFSPGAVKQINLLESDIGRPLSNISTNIKFETIIEDVKKVLQEGCVVSKEIETKNECWFQLMTMPYIRQKDKKQSGAIITFNDITAVKQMQLELDKKNERLLRVNADLEHFIYAASHDLLAPLGHIESSIDIINHIPVSEPELFDYLNIIDTSIKQFRQLVTEIAGIAKIESDMSFLEPVDLNTIITEVEWSLQDKIRISDAVILRDLEVNTIMFSKKNLRSIIYNLISNAIKFKRDDPPVVTIATSKIRGAVVLAVEDNGIGIKAANIESIFKVYGRLNHHIEGDGIGLHLIKKIVNAAGGKLEVKSEPGKGTKFSIYFEENVVSQ